MCTSSILQYKWRISYGYMGFPCGSAGKESACNEGDLGSIPELGISPGEGKGDINFEWLT